LLESLRRDFENLELYRKTDNPLNKMNALERAEERVKPKKKSKKLGSLEISSNTREY